MGRFKHAYSLLLSLSIAFLFFSFFAFAISLSSLVLSLSAPATPRFIQPPLLTSGLSISLLFHSPLLLYVYCFYILSKAAGWKKNVSI